MQPVAEHQQRERVTYPNLPLAVYREIAAHLRQVEGIEVELIPQASPAFDYLQSQIAGLWIQYPPDLPLLESQLLEEILTHYGKAYGLPERSESLGMGQ